MAGLMPITEPLKPLERRIFEALVEEKGKWLTRASVSRLLGRPRIFPGDVAALERLTALGIIEAREAPRGVAGIRWEYRVKTDE